MCVHAVVPVSWGSVWISALGIFYTLTSATSRTPLWENKGKVLTSLFSGVFGFCW